RPELRLYLGQLCVECLCPCDLHGQQLPTGAELVQGCCCLAATGGRLDCHANEVGSIGSSELAHNMVAVALRCLECHLQFGCDLFCAHAVNNQTQHFFFTLGEFLQHRPLLCNSNRG